jgi:PAS domain S-box-containing protein
MIANLQTGILLEDNTGRIAMANKAFCDIFSIPLEPKQLIGVECRIAAEQSKSLFQNPADFILSTNMAITNGKMVENEVFNMADGRIIERNFIPLFSRTKFEGQLWQYQDITERQHTQQAILESEEKYRGVLENMALGLLEVDLNDTILRANNAFCQMVGYQPDELIGINAGNQFLTDSYKKIISERLDERKMDQASVYEIQMKRKNGDLIWGLISGAPVKNSQGHIIGSIGIQFDLTDRKKLENELAEAKLIADRARLAERQFLTHMSHEIRTPINAVIGMTHLLEDTNPNATQKDFLNSLRFSADSLLGIIDNILDLSKIDAGEIEFEQKPFDLEYLVKSLVNTIHYRIGKKNIDIWCHVDPTIDNIVVGDPTRLNQILTNLLGNATKFTEKGVISVQIQLLNSFDGQYLLEFRVHDSGIGIPADKLETIFEYFKQADVQINRKFGGTGLGLTIVKQLVEMQGGAIRVESELGVGSDFIFTLPMGDSGIPVLDHKILSDIDQHESQKIKKGLHFLIVEDNLMNQKLICKTIETWECTFEVANNGLEALEKTALRRFDVILMDIHMPEMDGCETTLAIRNDPQNPNQKVSIIALTAAAMSDEKRRAFEAGMNGFLTKPIAPKMLQEHILRSIRELRPEEPSEPDTRSAVPSSQPDLSYLMELSNGDLPFVESIIDAFLSETPATLKSLKLLVHQKNWDQVYKIAHKLKPNFAMLGMTRLQEMTVTLEIIVKKIPVDESKSAHLAYSLIDDVEKIFPLLANLKNNE